MSISMATLGSTTRVFWTPKDLGTTALAIWLDADDAGTFTYSSGSVVSQWNDKSGNGRHFTNSTTSEQPERVTNVQNSRAVVRFTTDRLRATASGVTALGYRYFLVMKLATTGTAQRIVQQSSGTQNGHFETSTTAYVLYSHPTGMSRGTPNTSWRIVMPLYNSTSSQLWLNGTQSGTTASTGTGYPSELCIGGFPTGTAVGQWYDGDIAEMLVIDGSLTTADRERVEGYLAHRWGLTGNLPSGHPYKNAAP